MGREEAELRAANERLAVEIELLTRIAVDTVATLLCLSPVQHGVDEFLLANQSINTAGLLWKVRHNMLLR